jgi:hypothetical protein
MSAFVGVYMIQYYLCALIAMCMHAGRPAGRRADRYPTTSQRYDVRAAAVSAHNIGHNPSPSG